MPTILPALLVLLCALSARAATLRTIYIDTNGRDIRLEALVDKWWAENADETVDIPAGTKIKQRRTATTLLDSNWTVPVAMTIKLRNPSPSETARLVFSSAPQGNTTLKVTRFTPVSSCGTLKPPECIACGGASYRLQTASAPWQYGRFQQPAFTPQVSFVATVSASTGFQANVEWDCPDCPFPTNLQGNSSDANITAWIAYLPGPLGDTGKTVVDALPSYYAFSSSVYPEGFLVPRNASGGFQAYLDRAGAKWIAGGCPRASRADAYASLYPYPTLAGVVSASTNALYGGRNLRSCSFLNADEAGGLIYQAIKCSYEDLEQALIIRLADGLTLMEKLRSAQLPPPSPPSLPPPSPPPSLPLPPSLPRPLPPSPQPRPSLRLPQPPLTPSALQPAPPPTDDSRVDALASSGCFLTSSDCDHGTLEEQPPPCHCVCEPGWGKSRDPQEQRYCTLFTGKPASPPPPPRNTSSPVWRSPRPAPPPPTPKQYESESWWQKMGLGGWLGLVCGLIAVGIMVAVCSCYGRSLWSMCIGCCWHRPQRSKKKDEDAYVQIQALRQQLQDLQSKMSTETQ